MWVKNILAHLHGHIVVEQALAGAIVVLVGIVVRRLLRSWDRKHPPPDD